jgi:hypothetical protein
MAQRFEIQITKREAWYVYSMTDHLTDKVHSSSKLYNSEGGALEAAKLLADKLVWEQPPATYWYGLEL